MEVVPHTTHNLQQEDRARLIRSTRKIQEVVGETPNVVDIASIPVPSSSHKWSHKIVKGTRHKSSRDAPRSDHGLNGVAASQCDSARPTLYLRVPEVPHADQLLRPTPPPSPTLTVALNLPNVADYLVKDEAQARRRKMAKLVHTLGTNVPPELVFPPNTRSTKERRRLTARTLLSDRAESVRSGKSSIRSGKGATRIEHWRSGVASPSTSPATPSRASERPMPRGPRAARTQSQRRAKAEPVEPISRGWVWVGRAADIPAHVRVHKPARAGSAHPHGQEEEVRDVVEEQLLHTPASTFRGMYRWQPDWTGQWVGAGNMQDVVSSLRDLKVK